MVECFKSVKTLGSSTFLAVKKAPASAFVTAKIVENLGLYPIHTTINDICAYQCIN